MHFGPRERELPVTIDMPKGIQRLRAWQPGEHNISWFIAQMRSNANCQASYTQDTCQPHMQGNADCQAIR